jgi:hypothetical protein
MKILSIIRNSALFFLFSNLMLFTGCKKDNDDAPAAPVTIFTVNFTDNYINPQLNAIVFISDMTGKLLSDTLVSGNGSIQVQVPSGTQVPSEFMVSIVTWEFFIHNFLVSINTYNAISKSTWTFTGHRADTVGRVTISLNNVPPHTGPVLFSNAGYSNVTFITDNRINNLYRSPDDLYIHLLTSEGPRYKWISGITKGGTYNIDMAQSELPVLQDISFPITSVYYEGVITGYQGQDMESPLYFLVDELLGDGIPVNSIPVSYPPSHFTAFHTELSLITDWSSPSTYSYWVDGAIPAAFKKIDADVITLSSSTGRADFTATGAYNVSNANWSFSATNNLIFEWNVYGPDSTTVMILPELSPSMHQMFPDLSIDSLTLQNIRLLNFYGLSSYNDFITKMFADIPTVGMKHMEASTVKRVPGK